MTKNVSLPPGQGSQRLYLHGLSRPGDVAVDDHDVRVFGESYAVEQAFQTAMCVEVDVAAAPDPPVACFYVMGRP